MVQRFTASVTVMLLVITGFVSAQQPLPGTPPGSSYLDRQRLDLARVQQQRQWLKEQIMRQAQARRERVEREIAAFRQQQYQDRLRYDLGIYRGIFNTPQIHRSEADYYHGLAEHSSGKARDEYRRWADWHRDWAKKLRP